VVVRNGEKVVDTPVANLDYNKIVYHMTGHEIEESYYDYTPDASKPASLLKVDNLSLPGSFENVSFELRPGEILGVTGLLGSGRTELALALFGERPAASGTITIKGQQVRIGSIQDALRNHIGYVPEDRLTEGLFLERSIGNNIVARILGKLLNRMGMVDAQQVDDQIRSWIGQLHIKTNNPALPVRSLSGGNQQRVVIAKWLASLPQILILNGPTVGVDIGSKSELHEIIKGLARQGLGIIIISDDIPELMQTCNRILLMRQGRIVDEMITRETSEAELSAKLLAV
jgi:simple sugar transport system ATP-binding protein